MSIRRTIAVLYGGKSTEHEVSIVTALQAMHVLIEQDIEVLPVYVAKDGIMYLGDDRYVDRSLYTSLAHVTHLGTRCIFHRTPNEQPRLLLQSSLGGYRKAVTFDAAFPIFHGLNGEDGSIQGLLAYLNIPCVGSSLSSSALGIDKRVAKMLAGTWAFVSYPTSQSRSMRG